MKTWPKLTPHLVLANIAFAPSNFQLGDRELRRAIELSPSLAIAHQLFGSFARATGASR